MFNPAKELIARMGRGGEGDEGEAVPSESDSDWLYQVDSVIYKILNVCKYNSI